MKERTIDEKIKLYEKLGATKFQKLVFLVEKIKFKVLKTLVPNYLKYYDKHVDKVAKKKLQYASSDEEKKAIMYKSNIDKMKERKEFYQEKNRNYHMSRENPTEIIKYLEMNKRIHENGVKRNGIFIGLSLPFIILGSELAIIFLIIELLSLGINLECINLQNYNICRLEKIKDRLQKIEERRREREAEKFKDISKEIHEAVLEKEEIPTIDDILERADTPEKLAQLRELIENAKRERNISKTQVEKGNQKVIK